MKVLNWWLLAEAEVMTLNTIDRTSWRYLWYHAGLSASVLIWCVWASGWSRSKIRTSFWRVTAPWTGYWGAKSTRPIRSWEAFKSCTTTASLTVPTLTIWKVFRAFSGGCPTCPSVGEHHCPSSPSVILSNARSSTCPPRLHTTLVGSSPEGIWPPPTICLNCFYISVFKFNSHRHEIGAMMAITIVLLKWIHKFILGRIFNNVYSCSVYRASCWLWI